MSAIESKEVQAIREKVRTGKIKSFDKIVDALLAYVKDPNEAEKIAHMFADKYGIKESVLSRLNKKLVKEDLRYTDSDKEKSSMEMILDLKRELKELQTQFEMLMNDIKKNKGK